MSILDDLLVCEQRAKILAETRRGGETPSTREGREAHKQLNKLARLLARRLESYGYKILEGPYVESPLVFYTISTTSSKLVMVGVPDVVAFIANEDGFFTLNVEVTTYHTALETVHLRQALYALALYERYGFPVVPVLLVTPSLGETRAYILYKGVGWENGIRWAAERLAKLLEGEVEPKPPRSRNVCSSCPPRIRGLCPLYGG